MSLDYLFLGFVLLTTVLNCHLKTLSTFHFAHLISFVLLINKKYQSVSWDFINFLQNKICILESAAQIAANKYDN